MPPLSLPPPDQDILSALASVGSKTVTFNPVTATNMTKVGCVRRVSEEHSGPPSPYMVRGRRCINRCPMAKV